MLSQRHQTPCGIHNLKRGGLRSGEERLSHRAILRHASESCVDTAEEQARLASSLGKSMQAHLRARKEFSSISALTEGRQPSFFKGPRKFIVAGARAENSGTPKSLFCSVLTVKNLCLVQNRQAVYSKKKKTKQFGLLSISDLAEIKESSKNQLNTHISRLSHV